MATEGVCTAIVDLQTGRVATVKSLAPWVKRAGRGDVAAIQGRVAWSRDTLGQEGIGIEFQCRDMAGKRRIRELIRRLREFLTNPPKPMAAQISGRY